MTAASPTVAATDVSDKEVLDSESRMPQNGGPDAQSGAKGMAKARPGTLKRLLKYIFHYKVRMVFIILSIIVSAVACAGAALFLQSLIDRYILPLVGKPNPVWTPLIEALILMGILYALGTLCSWLYNYLLVGVEQGVMKTIRDEMFEHMQTLSISFFDTHEHGDLMSRYTNDTDTLRKAISQSLPQMFASGITALAALISMFWLSVPYTVFVLVFTALLLLLSQGAGQSFRPLLRQAAAGARRRERLRGGGRERSEGGQGVQPRRRDAGGLRRPQRTAVPRFGQREHLRQCTHARRGQHGLPALCALRRLRQYQPITAGATSASRARPHTRLA